MCAKLEGGKRRKESRRDAFAVEKGTKDSLPEGEVRVANENRSGAMQLPLPESDKGPLVQDGAAKPLQLKSGARGVLDPKERKRKEERGNAARAEGALEKEGSRPQEKKGRVQEDGRKKKKRAHRDVGALASNETKDEEGLMHSRLQHKRRKKCQDADASEASDGMVTTAASPGNIEGQKRRHAAAGTMSSNEMTAAGGMTKGDERKRTGDPASAQSCEEDGVLPERWKGALMLPKRKIDENPASEKETGRSIDMSIDIDELRKMGPVILFPPPLKAGWESMYGVPLNGEMPVARLKRGQKKMHDIIAQYLERKAFDCTGMCAL